jgi:MoxR-like ATPases
MEAATNNASTATLMEQVLYEVKRVVVGKTVFWNVSWWPCSPRAICWSRGARPGQDAHHQDAGAHHPGQFKRIQFTPDLVPADLVGTRMYNQKTGEFSTTLGPVFTHLLLADEINRAPAKVQSALLEVMQERQVTIAGETHKVPAPFLVMATQNPIETEGTYALPEAQVDRFMMKVLLGYPTEEEEFVIAQRALAAPVQVLPVATTAQLSALQAECRSVYVDPSLLQYAVKLVAATRAPAQHGVQDIAQFIACGASPRATICLAEGAQALAMLRGRAYVLPEDMTDLAADVLRHRLSLSYEALSDGLDADALIARIMAKIPAPARPLHHLQNSLGPHHEQQAA